MALWKIDTETEDDFGDIIARCENYESGNILIIREQDSPKGEKVLAAYESLDGGDTWESIGGSGQGTPLRAHGVMFRALLNADRHATNE